MANSSTPFGFMPYGRVDGGSPTWELEEFGISSADTNLYFTGDLVIRSSASQGNIATSTGVGGTIPPVGVFWGCKFFNAAAGKVQWSRFYPGTATSGARAYVISDPNTLFRSMSVGTFVAADIGNTLTVVTSQSSLGNQNTGQSAMLVSTTLGNNSSAPWQLYDLLANRSVSGAPGTDAAAFNQVVLRPNSWGLKAGTITTST